VGFWQVVTGRSRPKPANLDSLFLVPSAAITLQTSLGLTPTGDGSVCYRAAAGAGFTQTQDDVLELLASTPDAPTVQTSVDSFGYTWLQVHREAGSAVGPDMGGLCTDLHAVNTSLEAEGFGPGLLCSLVPFRQPGGRRVGLVYLYKQGTFFPFAPTGPQQRDNLLEISVRDALAAELPFEPMSGWMALWGAPGL
jgi:hypothetical protein